MLNAPKKSLTFVSRSLFGALAAVLSTAVNAAGFAGCPQFFPHATPVVKMSVAAKHRELCFDAFAVLHSGEAKTPLYVVERLNRAQLLQARDETRSDRFYEEARLPASERATLEDYRVDLLQNGVRVPMDRGHMAPAADMPHSAAMAQSFSLANIVPQAPQNNRKTWAGIEKATRHFVMRAKGDVFVFTGPAYLGSARKMGQSRVWVPSHLFKLVYDSSSGRAWAHWVENTNEARPSAPISYEELVQRTGIEFLPGLKPRR